MTHIPRPQEIYRHFKGNLYQVITVAEHSETGERLVIYQALYGDFKIYARELSMFMSRVDLKKYPNCTQTYRFMLADEFERGTTDRENVIKEPVGKAEETVKESLAGKAEETVKESLAGKAEETLDPMLIQFLDAKSYEEKLHVLERLHHRITQDMITIMAMSCDVEVGDGEVESQYQQLKSGLQLLVKFECNRLR